MRCFSNSAVPVTETTNFCNICGSEGTCIQIKDKDADYLRDNIKYAIEHTSKSE
jgi:hypothetical protein